MVRRSPRIIRIASLGVTSDACVLHLSILTTHGNVTVSKIF